MVGKSDKKARSERSALEIAERLGRLKPEELSERSWCRDAGVSPSFFSNLRGTPSKPASDPGVDQLRQVLAVIQTSLPEFFADEARQAATPLQTSPALEQAFADAMESLPRRMAERPAYLAEVVQRVLALPVSPPSNPASQASERAGESEEAAPPRATTSRS